MKLITYLYFDGNCKAALEFYAHVLGGDIQMMLTNAESPMADKSPPELKDKASIGFPPPRVHDEHPPSLHRVPAV